MAAPRSALRESDIEAAGLVRNQDTTPPYRSRLFPRPIQWLRLPSPVSFDVPRSPSFSVLLDPLRLTIESNCDALHPATKYA